MGLRAGDVARLRLDDLDWRSGELVVRGKGARRGPLVEVLRHESLQSTGIYARVDLDTLRRLAAPWPGGAR